jgi:hypothetical protein
MVLNTSGFVPSMLISSSEYTVGVAGTNKPVDHRIISRSIKLLNVKNNTVIGGILTMKRALNSLQEQLTEAVYGMGINGRNHSNKKYHYVAGTVKGSHDLTIVGFSLAKGMDVGNFLVSETFNVRGYDSTIYFYPDRKNPEDNSLYVSVFVALVSKGTDVRAKFELRLIDQSGRGKHKVHSHFEGSLERGPYTLKYHGSMWGYKRFYK